MPQSIYLMIDSMQGAYLIHGWYPVAIFPVCALVFGVRLPVSLALICGLAGAAELPYFSVLSEDCGSVAGNSLRHLASGKASGAGTYLPLFCARSGAPGSNEWSARVEGGAVLILDGELSLAEAFGFRRASDKVGVSSLTDVHNPKLHIVREE
jgi:hypothetical protein